MKSLETTSRQYIMRQREKSPVVKGHAGHFTLQAISLEGKASMITSDLRVETYTRDIHNTYTRDMRV